MLCSRGWLSHCRCTKVCNKSKFCKCKTSRSFVDHHAMEVLGNTHYVRIVHQNEQQTRMVTCNVVHLAASVVNETENVV